MTDTWQGIHYHQWQNRSQVSVAPVLFSVVLCIHLLLIDLLMQCSLLWRFWTSGQRLIDVGNCETFLLRYIDISSGKKLLKMWVGNVGNALLHFLFSVNNTLSLRQRVQIYLGPTFLGRPNKIFKTKLCLIRIYTKTVLNAKETALESNNKNPFWSRWGDQSNRSGSSQFPSHQCHPIFTLQFLYQLSYF